MNKIYVDIDFTNGILEKKGIDLITGDYASTEIEFKFEREDGRKVFEMKSPSGKLVYADEIVGNKVLLTAKDENENNVSLFDESGDYIFEVSLYVDNSKLTSVYGKLPVQKEQVEIEGEVVEKVLPLFEQLMQELATAITQTDNLNIDGSKSGKITTITITYKDGTTKELHLEDGKSIEYNWQGTQLGIRQEGQSEYVYVDLKGEPGQPGAIKMVIVEELPLVGSGDTLYFVPKEDTETSDLYDEYAWVNNAWERLGEKQIVVDLSNYYTKQETYSKTETNTLLNGKANTSDIPTKVSDLQNDSNFTTKSYVDGLVGNIATAIDLLNGEVI